MVLGFFHEEQKYQGGMDPYHTTVLDSYLLRLPFTICVHAVFAVPSTTDIRGPFEYGMHIM